VVFSLSCRSVTKSKSSGERPFNGSTVQKFNDRVPVPAPVPIVPEFTPGLRSGGFIAGFLSTLIFHQLVLGFLWSVGVAASAPFSMVATRPLGVPAVISLAFWGGLWGILFALSERRFARQGGYWLAAFLFGAVLPSLVALLIVLPLKGQPIGGGWRPDLWLTAFLINGAWGMGTGLILRPLLSRIGWARQAMA
jgi:hypothetical protein